MVLELCRQISLIVFLSDTTGENVMATLVVLASSSKLTNPGEDRHGSMVFFDYLGFFMVAYPKRMATILNWTTSLYVYVAFVKRMLREGASGRALQQLVIYIWSHDHTGKLRGWTSHFAMFTLSDITVLSCCCWTFILFFFLLALEWPCSLVSVTNCQLSQVIDILVWCLQAFNASHDAVIVRWK